MKVINENQLLLSSRGDLLCLYLNARSLINKKEEFEAMVENCKPDIIGVSESWASNKILDEELELPDYQMYRHDRPTHNHGGGVLLYVKISLKSVPISVNSNYPEQIWCKVTGLNDDELMVGVCYRTNNEAIFGPGIHQDLRDLLIEVSNKRVVLMGDFNYGDLLWQPKILSAGNSISVEAKLFSECLEDLLHSAFSNCNKRLKYFRSGNK